MYIYVCDLSSTECEQVAFFPGPADRHDACEAYSPAYVSWLPDRRKVGYVFAGWYWEANCAPGDRTPYGCIRLPCGLRVGVRALSWRRSVPARDLDSCG